MSDELDIIDAEIEEPKEYFGVVIKRDDGSYIITRNGYPYHVPNNAEFAELWARIDEYAQENPDSVVADVSPDLPQAEIKPDSTALINALLGVGENAC